MALLRVFGLAPILLGAGCSASSGDVGARGSETSPVATAAGPSSRPGMGAVVYGGGVTFRVWAPNATQVWVRGDFDGWAEPGEAMASEGNGNYSLDVSGGVFFFQAKRSLPPAPRSSGGDFLLYREPGLSGV